MTYIPVGLEMYSVRKEFAASPYATMKAVKAMGYEGVVLARQSGALTATRRC